MQNIKEHHIPITKTARYYTNGEITSDTQTVWFVVHGFAQRAEAFIQEFSFLDLKENFVIAPEALNRFYKKGPGGDTAATWMTKDDRENEIKDYVNYLNALYDLFAPQISQHTKVNVLGFSQGASTVSRWMIDNPRSVNKLIFYAGEIGKEIIEAGKLRDFHAQQKYFVFGKNDEVIPFEMAQQFAPLLEANDISFVTFDGGHEISEEVILSF